MFHAQLWPLTCGSLLQQGKKRVFAVNAQRLDVCIDGGRHWRGGFFGGKIGAAVLFPQQTGIDQRTLQMAGGIARVVLHVLPDLPADLIVDVLADKIGQLERPHAEVSAGLEGAVDLRRARHVLFQQAEPFQVVGAGHAVDDKPRRGLTDDIAFPQRGHQLTATFRGGVCGKVGRDDFNQFHQRRRVEKVQTDKPLAVRHRGCQLVKRQ